jgi:hypothetical protein
MTLASEPCTNESELQRITAVQGWNLDTYQRIISQADTKDADDEV